MITTTECYSLPGDVGAVLQYQYNFVEHIETVNRVWSKGMLSEPIGEKLELFLVAIFKVTLKNKKPC